ncbi:Signal peptidase I [Limihaloglobus sulfuriphilus]|uniref:Signal peptidase I n=1 Tax=Limihaloglobus sulfuriphilus TaxID=1851148 RepID=A0A1Q2MCH3_9BACT|nr:signal peptidase I [Limihaloglobus sulfuriphilus]AQQ69997.1 Signal peptidase I [Limihaloglobus sulfuriphilus]
MSDKQSPSKEKSLCSTFEWLLIALALAFTYRAFLLEAYKIPTGSMAPTLRGDRFAVACQSCGEKFDYGFIPERYRRGANREGFYQLDPGTICPNCGTTSRPVASKINGDRILVFKGSYYFHDPDRWDVFVFKNPTEPHLNYIKRLVGLPGEKIEIIDGDIYINDKITRKPAKVQNELWMPVFDSRLTEVVAYSQNREPVSPMMNSEGSNWRYIENGRSFSLDETEGKKHELYYNYKQGRDLRAFYSYNRYDMINVAPFFSDMMLEAYVAFPDQSGEFEAVLSKYGTEYTASLDVSGTMTVSAKEPSGKRNVIAEKTIKPLDTDRPVRFCFENLDHVLRFSFGPETLEYDFGREAHAMGEPGRLRPQIKVAGSGRLRVENLRIMRDIYYYGTGFDDETLRAGEGRPYTLGEDEFFACGDNSPASSDSRYWDAPGIGNNAKTYPAGVVPRDYLIGKAFFVYWPGSFKYNLNPKFSKLGKFAILPNVSEMKFIYGGVDDAEIEAEE